MIVRDSQEFATALRTWHPLIAAKHNTPRSIKRFMNRVRYYAMRQRPPEPIRPLWARLRWHGAAAQAAEASAEIPEEILVALSAIQQCHPEWLADERLYKEFVAFLQAHSDVLPAEITEHLKRFRRGARVGIYQEAFGKLSAVFGSPKLEIALMLGCVSSR